ncbi:Reticulocyte-binding protein 2 like protein a [Fusarium oxysporum f. sp. cubense race 1]|uniref:EKC/KEOPS complex subunit BUD32 n=1 Tax=Fusarium oxysporum f. sp. cubense (strain race 1) TaxID=1229664 RepID=N4U4M1_FUSC1|nr:Reticulocyte-binding protein 2 like protein a [Fusarium oxysporum f. sp. cubense race 1]
MEGSLSVEELTRLLQEAEQRAKEERQRAEKEQQRAEKEQQRAEREQQRAEKEQQRAEKEQQRAEEAERERQEERQRAEREQQRAEASEEQTRLTTLDEYIAACHASVFSRFAIETDPNLTSRGSITNPRDKWCPKNLRPWPDFLDQQKLTFGTLYDAFPTESRVFENRNFLAGLGNRISQRPIADEKTLEYFLHNSVEDPVRAIIQQLKQVEEVSRAFQIGDGVVFENHPHALSDVAEEVVDRETPSTPPRTPDHRRDLNQLRPDQICVYRSDNTLSSRRTMVYVSEYKPPHKLTAPHLRLGLRAMDIHKEVVNRRTIPTSVDPDARFQYHAEKLTASAITQTYHYMIESGLEYGLLTTGEAIVFLKVDWDEPQTLYYHLAEPGPEVSAHPNNLHICTAVGQYLAFTLMALGSPGERRGNRQEERQKAMETLRTWTEDFESTLRSIPENERSASSDYSPAYEPTTYKGVDRSPALPRKRTRRTAVCQIGEGSLRKDDGQEPSDDESAPPPPPPDTPTPTGRNTRQGTRRSQRLALRPRGGGGEQGRHYCTQKCLLGMVKGGFLDPKCPNVALHCKSCAPARARHPVDHKEWLRLLWNQLKQSLDDGIRPLGEGGARGVLFQVTLLAHGYTFVSKGTVRAFIQDLEHEAAVYERLKPIQGVHVPVFLGAVDLRSMNKTYYYDHRVYVVHMSFLSWGGCSIDRAQRTGDMDRSLEDEAIRSLRAMHREGVVHKDVRLANMLFNPETNRVMVIDFERALLLKPARRPLAQLVPNKRAWKSETMDAKKVTGDSSKRSRASQSFSEDIWLAKTAFLEWNADRWTRVARAPC